MWLGHVSVPDGRALLSHLAMYEQIAPVACEGAPACLLAVLQSRGGGGSSQLLAMGKWLRQNGKRGYVAKTLLQLEIALLPLPVSPSLPPTL